jgi:hypothetical protein
MKSSPYRALAQPELIVQGEPSSTVYLWAIWLATAMVVAVTLLVDDMDGARIGLIAAGAAICGTVVVLHRRARRVRWLISLDGFELRIERRSGSARHTVVIDVERGVYLGVGMSDGTARLDPCIIIIAGGAHVSMTTGVHPAATLDRLVEFLRGRDVTVMELPDVPVGWYPGGF